MALLTVAAMALAGCGQSAKPPTPDVEPSVTVTTTSPPPGAGGAPPGGIASTSPGPTGGESTSPDALESKYEQVITTVLPSIVQITTQNGLGSGVIYDSAGHIITNAHVVGRSRNFEVSLASGGKPRSAKLVSAYELGDLAVIKVDDPSGLKPARFGDSSKLRVGQLVLAMGNPLGLSGSVTNGIVSALGRTVSEPQEQGAPGATITGAIQTSAAINPGNSGGALVNLANEVIGIPTLTAVNPELGGGAAPGIGFAIPSNAATDIANQIIKNGRVVNTHRAALGVTVQTVAGSDGRAAGVGVVRVAPGGSASKVGIRRGDVIVAINDTPVPNTQTLSEVLAALRPGDRAKIEILHPDGSTATVTVPLGELPVG
ncbi:S1C family serine protease [Streptosporangium carneum]|uniref:S1C family serine protease n=1 Tax=Streptosporangium carneum TaxID=47481 RepID=UPI0022F320E4|nr:trypsin-like peptidase domain-containing protein [Streptosporangium carneum]